jgi:hypothetical protein
MDQTPIVGRTYRAERGSSMIEPQAIAVARKEHGVSAPAELMVIETTDDLRGWGWVFIAIGIGAVFAINAVWGGLLLAMITRSRAAEPKTLA